MKYLLYSKYIVLVCISLGFLIFGVRLLISSYTLRDAHTFIMMFFSSSLIILISAAFAVGLVSRIIHKVKSEKKEGDSDLTV